MSIEVIVSINVARFMSGDGIRNWTAGEVCLVFYFRLLVVA